MPVMDPSAAAEQAQPQTQTLPAGGEQPPRQEPVDFTSLVEGMNDANEIRDALFGMTPIPPQADVEPTGQTPGDTPQADAAAVADDPAGAQPQDAATDETTPAEPQHAPNLERISLKSLHPDSRLRIAQAKEMVREGKAASFEDAFISLVQPQAGTQEPSPQPAATAPDSSTQPAPAQPQPVAEQDPEVSRLASHLDSLRAQRKAAVEEFDRPKEINLTDEIEDTLAALSEAKSQAVHRSRESHVQEQAINATIQDIYVAHPESEDPRSFFSYRLTQEVQSYEASYGSIQLHPQQLRVLADKVHAEIAGNAAPAAQPQPAPAPAPRQAARPLGASAPGSAGASRPSPDHVQRLIETSDEATIRAALFGAL